jgi:hypothetical protein
MGFLSRVRGRLARLLTRVGAILFLILLTGVLLAPDSVQQFVGDLSLVIRGLILAAIYVIIALVYQVRIDKYLGLNYLSKLLSRPRKTEAAPPVAASSAPVQPLHKPPVATPVPEPETSAEAEPEKGSEPEASTPVEPDDAARAEINTPEPEPAPEPPSLAEEDSSKDDDDPEFWDFLRSTARDEQDDTETRS